MPCAADRPSDLVVAIESAPASEQETNWLEWKSRLDLSAKATEATIAKAVLGFASRDPDAAARFAEGCAYMVVGVEPGALSGVEPIDMAKLEAGVAVYTGAGAQWRADYVDVGDQTVLVVTVEPPRWGDSIHVVRKAFLPNVRGEAPMPAAAIFVRHAASTEQASPADMDMLNARMVRQPGTYLDVRVEPVGNCELVGIDDSDDALDDYVDAQEALLLNSLSANMPFDALSPAAFGEYRSKDAFRKEVSEYAEKLLRRLPMELNDRCAQRGLAVLDLELVNPTDATFQSVRVELRLPSPVLACGFLGDLRGKGLPSRPAPYGSGNPMVGRSWDLISSISLEPAVVRPMWVPKVRRTDSGAHVLFQARDSRASGRAPLEHVWLVLGADHDGPVLVEWEATAYEARARARGSFEVPVAERRLSPAEVLADDDVYDDE